MKSVTFRRPDENDHDIGNTDLSMSISKASTSLTNEIHRLSQRESVLSQDMRALQQHASSLKKKERMLSDYASDLVSKARALEEARRVHERNHDQADEEVRHEKQRLKTELNEIEQNSVLLEKKRESIANLSSRMQKKLQDLAVFEEECDRDEDELGSFLEMQEKSPMTCDCSALQDQIDELKQSISGIDAEIEKCEISLASRKLDLVETKSEIAKVQQREIAARQQMITYENKNFSFQKAIDSKSLAMKQMQIKYRERSENLQQREKRSNVISSKLNVRLERVTQALSNVAESTTKLKKQLDDNIFWTNDTNQETCKIRACLEMCKRRHSRRQVKWKLDIEEVRQKRRKVNTKRELCQAKIKTLKKIEEEKKQTIQKYDSKLTKADTCTSKLTELAVDLLAKEDSKKLEESRETQQYIAKIGLLRELQERIVRAERIAQELTALSVAPRSEISTAGIPVPKSSLEKELKQERKEMKAIKKQIKEQKQALETMRRERIELQKDIDNSQGILRYLLIKKDLRADQLEVERMHAAQKCNRDISYIKCRIQELNTIVSNRKRLIGDKQSVLNRVVTQKHFRVREEDICPLARALQMIDVEKALWSVRTPVPVDHMLGAWLTRLRNQ